jgi:hypothetical protein
MAARFQFDRGAAIHVALAAFVLATWLMSPLVMRGQDAPRDAIGRVDGRDISVEGGIAGSGVPGTAAPIIYVLSGSVVTVHAGKARMTLFAGGKVEICGPAKLTVLRAGDAVTLALNFGRVRVELPAKTALRIFTPTIVGTPIDIRGGSRDVTVGLNLDDSLCVLATSGAVQLEQQFTGEKIIVPEAGEFYLNAGRLLAVAGAPGSCQCLADEPKVTPPTAATAPEFAAVAPSRSAADPLHTATAEQPAEREPGIEYSVLQDANRAHPIAASTRIESPVAPPAPMPSDLTIVQALVFSANAPLVRPGPSDEIRMLIREARVSHEWEFSGRVEAPEFAQAIQTALGEHATAPRKTESKASGPTEKQKKKGGFWAALRRAFGAA